jgi:hypothetical protein
LHRDLLRHLLNRRNDTVHRAGSLRSEEGYLYELKRYVEAFLHISIRNPFGADNINEFNSFLDYPPDTEYLKEKKSAIDALLEFRRDD